MCSFLHQLRKQVWWHRSFILGDLNGKFFQVGYRVKPKLNAQQGAICAAFFSKCSEQSTSCFLVPTSLWLDPIDSLALATVVFWLHFFFLAKEKHAKKTLCQLFTATNCSTLARHALKLICQTTLDSILFKSLLSHVGQLSCCDVMEVTWLKAGFSAADDTAARSIVFVFIQINTFMYLRKMSIYQTNSVYVKLYLYRTIQVLFTT